jgi:hypothetical protein
MSQCVTVDSNLSHDYVPTEKSRRSYPGPLHVDPALGWVSELVEYGGADVDVIVIACTTLTESATVI